jgi:NADH-quinone oxidoreductase subunit E
MDEVSATILRNYPAGKKQNLIPVLQDFKRKCGVLTDDIIREISDYLNLPVNKIQGVISFYDQFSKTGNVNQQIRVCCGINCHLEGSDTLVRQLDDLRKGKPGYGSRENGFNITTTTCMGACSNSPVISANDVIHTRITREKLVKLVDSLKEDAGKGI